MADSPIIWKLEKCNNTECLHPEQVFLDRVGGSDNRHVCCNSCYQSGPWALTDEEAVRLWNKMPREDVRLRDHFAGMALQGYLADIASVTCDHHDYLAQWSYKMADAMLKERENDKD